MFLRVACIIFSYSIDSFGICWSTPGTTAASIYWPPAGLFAICADKSSLSFLMALSASWIFLSRSWSWLKKSSYIAFICPSYSSLIDFMDWKWSITFYCRFCKFLSRFCTRSRMIMAGMVVVVSISGFWPWGMPSLMRLPKYCNCRPNYLNSACTTSDLDCGAICISDGCFDLDRCELCAKS